MELANITVDQFGMLELTGQTELPWNEELKGIYTSEEGLIYTVQITRAMFIGEQINPNELQDWAWFEMIDLSGEVQDALANQIS